MFGKISNLIGSRTLRSILIASAVAAAPSAAFAGRFDTHRDRDDDRREWRRDDDRRDGRRDDDRGSGRIDIRIGGESWERVPAPLPPVYEERVWVEPVFRTVFEQRWAPATYTTVVDRVWVEPVVQRPCERVWIADRYELRDVTHWENGRRVTRRESVLVEAGHYAEVSRDVVITPGHYEDRPRQQLVCDGHYETVTRQEVIVPGHWETRPMRVVVAKPRYDQVRLDLSFPLGR